MAAGFFVVPTGTYQQLFVLVSSRSSAASTDCRGVGHGSIGRVRVRLLHHAQLIVLSSSADDGALRDSLTATNTCKRRPRRGKNLHVWQRSENHPRSAGSLLAGMALARRSAHAGMARCVGRHYSGCGRNHKRLQLILNHARHPNRCRLSQMSSVTGHAVECRRGRRDSQAVDHHATGMRVECIERSELDLRVVGCLWTRQRRCGVSSRAQRRIIRARGGDRRQR